MWDLFAFYTYVAEMTITIQVYCILNHKSFTLTLKLTLNIYLFIHLLFQDYS